MFKHGKTKKEYYSVREKIQHYTEKLNNKNLLTIEQREYAVRRLKQLKQIDRQTYNEPTLIMTDDKLFGNKISKPRVAVAVKTDNSGRILVAPLYKTTSKQVVLDRDCGRQISSASDGKNKWLIRDNIYDLCDITGVEPLTDYDKQKIKNLYK